MHVCVCVCICVCVCVHECPHLANLRSACVTSTASVYCNTVQAHYICCSRRVRTVVASLTYSLIYTFSQLTEVIEAVLLPAGTPTF